MSDELNRQQVAKQCADFLHTIGTPGFIVMGWKKPDGTIDMVQSLKGISLGEFSTGIGWSLQEAAKNLKH